MSKQPTNGGNEVAEEARAEGPRAQADRVVEPRDGPPAEIDADPPAAAGQATAEPENGESADSAAPGDAAALAAEVERLQGELEREADAALRARAETENFRRRAERDVENAHKFGQERFATELLPVIDSLELGLSAAQDDTVSVASVREGLELTVKMFEQAAQKFGLEQVDPGGSPFDPEFHQAISMQESESVESGTVLNVVQKGYLLHGRVLRPAMVIVAK